MIRWNGAGVVVGTTAEIEKIANLHRKAGNRLTGDTRPHAINHSISPNRS